MDTRNEPTHIIYFGHRIEIQPEVIADRKAYNNEWYHKWRKSATKDDIEVLRTKRRNQYRVRKQKTLTELSAEQLETKRVRDREYRRKQRRKQRERDAKKAEPKMVPIADMDTALKELAQGTAMLRWKPLAAAIAAL